MLRYSASIKSVNMRHLMNLKQSLLSKPRSFWRDADDVDVQNLQAKLGIRALNV